MAQSEQFATQDNAAREGNAPRRGPYPLIVVLVAAAFAANAWFFYHQGQRDGANPGSEATPIAAPVTPSENAVSPVTAPQAAADNAATASAPQPDSTAPASADSTQPSATSETTRPAAADDAASQPAADSMATASADSAQSSAANETATPAVTKPAPQRVASAKKPAKRLVAKVAKPAPSATAKSYDHLAVLLDHPKPTYPAQAVREHEQGTVLVLAQVDVSGHVSDARVVGRSGSYALDRAAENEVHRWKFEPALHNGQAVVASVEVPISYRLDQ